MEAGPIRAAPGASGLRTWGFVAPSTVRRAGLATSIGRASTTRRRRRAMLGASPALADRCDDAADEERLAMDAFRSWSPLAAPRRAFLKGVGALAFGVPAL